MKMETLQELYLDMLKDTYDAEQQLTKSLPKMAKACENEELRAAFEEHLEVTNGQIQRLDQIFEMLGEKSKGKKCMAMKGLLEEAKELMEEDADPNVLDAGLIAAAQKVEHYEIAAYGCLRTYAELMGLDEQAELLQETLDEEKEADDNLTDLAETCINLEAEEGGEMDEESEESDEEKPKNRVKGQGSKV
ncbi:MAG: ferritin-like domain-containing protein [Verrucomicrobiota bacterium]|nr:ferritin-like domain-containing protein [Verrucomicrobiota bacterium]